MEYSNSLLKNKLPLLHVLMPNESVTTTVWVKTGSRNEDLKVNGISHFLEHMVFKGGKKRPSAKLVSEAVDSFGGEFNAATSKDYTLFYIKSDLENFEKSLDVLSDMVLSPVLDKKEIEREKGVIVEEIKMYEDIPQRNIHDVFENLAFSGSSLSWDIAGSPKTVRGIKRTDFVNYRNSFYYPQNMLISVVGGVSKNKAKDLVNKYFGEFSGTKSYKSINDQFVSLQKKPQIYLKKKKTEQANILLGFNTHGRNYKGRFAQAVLSGILGGGMSSRLFTEVRERRGLAYSVKNSIERYQEVGYMGTYAGTDPKKATEALKVILEQCYGLANKKYKVDKKEFEKAKGYLKGHMALSLEDSGVVTDFFAEQFLFGDEILTPKEVLRKIDKISVDEVYEEAHNIFTKNNLNLAIIGPFDNEDMFDKVVN